MNDTEILKLIDGTFNPTDASQVILGLINHKINFHGLDAFSNEIRNRDDDGHAAERVTELTLEKARMQRIAQKANESGKRIKISCDIHVSVVDDE
ncbi:hypothetical protein [Flavobacterium litorale]|uniref:Uncharacterized protein n=1 Tax=Flavobacterium litorale TaxID=2856519 RepID=A0ABX8V7U5_9FLAO|nr:hypothetical protein [Flavobacterium litorale]QYJ68900.1 hypothetical protein K1I41_03175 [Flavobacterium litorale]